MTAKINRGRAVKLKTVYTSEERNKNAVRTATELKTCFTAKKVDKPHNLHLPRQSVLSRSKEVPNVY